MGGQEAVSEQVGYGRLGRRLRRILVILPYAIRHPGVSVDELAAKFGIDRSALLEDLNLVFLCGLPGYGPGDLIDVSLDEDRIYVRMADYFASPLRLSAAEALVLYASAAALTQLPDMSEAEALRRALAKLGRALGVAPDDGPAPIQVHLERGPAAHLSVLRDALERNRRIQMEYFSASRAELTAREVDPWSLIAALGRWYLVGLDHDSGEERMFRVDRIKSVETTNAEAPVPEDFDATHYKGAFSGTEERPRVSFEISPDAARWFEDYYPVASSETLPDGWRRLRLVASSDRWAAGLVVRLGPHVRGVKPRSVVDEARRLAERLMPA
jgi:proteasome accessory factor C